MTFKHKINKLFRELRKNDCVAIQQVACCRSCAWAEFEDPKENGLYVFTTDQQKDEHLDGYLFIYGTYPANICDLMQACHLSWYRPTENRENTAIKLIA